MIELLFLEVNASRTIVLESETGFIVCLKAVLLSVVHLLNTIVHIQYCIMLLLIVLTQTG